MLGLVIVGECERVLEAGSLVLADWCCWRRGELEYTWRAGEGKRQDTVLLRVALCRLRVWCLHVGVIWDEDSAKKERKKRAAVVVTGWEDIACERRGVCSYR